VPRGLGCGNRVGDQRVTIQRIDILLRDPFRAAPGLDHRQNFSALNHRFPDSDWKIKTLYYNALQSLLRGETNLLLELEGPLAHGLARGHSEARAESLPRRLQASSIPPALDIGIDARDLRGSRAWRIMEDAGIAQSLIQVPVLDGEIDRLRVPVEHCRLVHAQRLDKGRRVMIADVNPAIAQALRESHVPALHRHVRRELFPSLTDIPAEILPVQARAKL